MSAGSVEQGLFRSQERAWSARSISANLDTISGLYPTAKALVIIGWSKWVSDHFTRQNREIRGTAYVLSAATSCPQQVCPQSQAVYRKIILSDPPFPPNMWRSRVFIQHLSIGSVSPEDRVVLISPKTRRIALDILVTIWGKSVQQHPALYASAAELFASATQVDDRIWLHYGMTLLVYDFFRLTTATVGQISRYQETITPKEVKQKLIAELGQLGSLDKAAERVLFSLRNWGILVESEQRYAYRPLRRHFDASTPDLEAWLLAAALTAHPAHDLPLEDLLRLPELFPFRFTVNADLLRRSGWFEVYRQGSGWDMVALAETGYHTRDKIVDLVRQTKRDLADERIPAG